ncbi:acyltransferase [Bacteroides caccae]|uniref:acyltransferase family protein n=1 Tax=Bacteroides caccae TaxID=47678 RepID=UPI001C2C6779|nr:acyltransferase [Bacteroides caccae]MBU9956896.1 acyltransferase [Bacteroides caccae]MBV3649763.1 acyltransferase [Bacteroides caccae]MBV3673821.1 acyltransferase [Bacteroides caccae]MBV3681153.1 acyltransferase [Bacteroides caccae]MBV3699091.1 acyltransferase [Bacteroides caccae]
MATEKKILQDVVLLRPLAILLIVIYHSFIIYMHEWDAPVAFQDIKAYWWIAKFAISFSLELFVFFSGYIYYLQCSSKGNNTLSLIKNKFRRLYIPAIVFSVAYMLLFYRDKSLSCLEIIQYLITGAGHLWYLPMLFGVFLFASLLLKLPDTLFKCMFIALACLAAIIQTIHLPLNLSFVLYYTPFFLLGYEINKYRHIVLRKCVNTQNIVITVIMYFLLFIICNYTKEYIDNNEVEMFQFVLPIVKVMVKVVHLIVAFLGIIVCYIVVNKYLIGGGVPACFKNLNENCFGVYLFQQFILMFIYYHTPLSQMVSPYILPLIALLITITSSYLLTFLFRKSKVGRLLIG